MIFFRGKLIGVVNLTASVDTLYCDAHNVPAVFAGDVGTLVF